MLAFHVLGGDHFWSNAPWFFVLGLVVFLGAAMLRTKLERWAKKDDGDPPDARPPGERND